MGARSELLLHLRHRCRERSPASTTEHHPKRVIVVTAPSMVSLGSNPTHPVSLGVRLGREHPHTRFAHVTSVRGDRTAHLLRAESEPPTVPRRFRASLRSPPRSGARRSLNPGPTRCRAESRDCIGPPWALPECGDGQGAQGPVAQPYFLWIRALLLDPRGLHRSWRHRR